ncbi:hypothetical protein M885DRAFT_504901 [Pelagophyceae sp. CCMP2097]|nr:hypothetical protein M885DRAFT_504901 [Pelagophyceae sp. CCMP2097]
MSSVEEQAAAVAQMRREMAQAAQRELLTKITEKCFVKCAKTTSGNHLERNEQQCMAMCIDRYVDCMNGVNEALVARQNSRT